MPHYDSEYLKILTEDFRQPLALRELAQIILDDRATKSAMLSTMNHVHSLLSLVRHRHLPRGLDDLEQDIDRALGDSEKILAPWWKAQMEARKS